MTVAMITASVLVCLFLAGAWGYPSDSNRIIGGTQASIGEFPWAVSLQQQGFPGSHFCGGSIIGPRHVLTASHCVHGQRASDIQIQYGIVDIYINKNTIDVKEIIMHKDYVHGGNYPNDIAILVLDKEMRLDGQTSRAVQLPNNELNIPNELVNGKLCGWGYTETESEAQEFLLYTDLPIYNHNKCQLYIGRKYDPKIHVCAGSFDGLHKQCSGDSGGPLTVNNVQYGVVSWSVKPCTIINRPGVFANVANFRSWITENSGI